VSRRPPEPAPLTAGRRFRLLAVYRTAAVVLASYGLHAVAGRLRGAEWADAELPRVHRANARRVLATILEVRGLFIKVGQLVSVLSSVLPADFRDELAELQDRIPPRPWEEIRGRLAAELGDPETVFAEVDRTPVAAASLAQVHSARLADGRRVAVKVQHLGVERLARLDLATVRRVLRIVSLATGARGLGERRQGPRAAGDRPGVRRRDPVRLQGLGAGNPHLPYRAGSAQSRRHRAPRPDRRYRRAFGDGAGSFDFALRPGAGRRRHHRRQGRRRR
jgi:hypothetical protein